ncbi:uroporphyrinogen-III synthase [Arthrobacter agilis]|uniref:uroporphyrinogen-III synthase n=1 Tax=Arthrobacter agilis TaxID=37921 RepID=UPI00278A14BE|nr:uroporphyrinogen-III synthase [Arthrobacter agilis]MDQ0735583.1 uroporphyrinogen-III synthase [Arthrobacter agilis]
MAEQRAEKPVIVLRHPARAVRIAEALGAAGLTAYALPLTDTELPVDTAGVAEALARLGRGGYAWLVVTSGNTVQSLEMLVRTDGTTLAALVRAGHARVAAVGAATARLLTATGTGVDLVPGRASSAGLLDAFGPGPGEVLLPQADLAPDDLRIGLTGLGWSVHRVEAYRTVPYPAHPARRVPGVEEEGTPPPLLSVPDVVGTGARPVHPAVVFTAPSAVLQFRERLGGGPLAFLPVAIGPTTAAALRSQGWEPAATAAEPTPPAIVAAVEDAFSRGRTTYFAPLNGDRP